MPKARPVQQTRAEPRPVHECVHEHVKDAKITYAEIAAKTGWSEQRVYRLLSGKTDLTAEDMKIFAALLDKPVGELYGDHEAVA